MSESSMLQTEDERPEQLEDGRLAEAPVAVVAPVEAEAEQPMDEIMSEMAAAETEVRVARKTLEEAQAKFNLARAKRDKVRERQAKERSKQPANAELRRYLDTQRAERQRKADERRAIRESGINLDALRRSPLDEALRQRKPPANTRPSMVPQPVKE